MSDSTADEIRPIGPFWSWFRWSLIGVAAMSFLLLLSNLHMHLFLLRAFEWDLPLPISELEGMIADGHQLIIGISYFVVLIVCFVAYARFFQRSMFNARLIDPTHKTVSPVGMWLWCFVPFASLWMPFKGVRQVWSILLERAGEPVHFPPVFAIWWGGWVASGVISNLTWRLPGGAWDFQLSAANYQDFLTVNLIDMFLSLLNIVATLALLSIARKIARLQQDAATPAREPVPTITSG